jgi:hypothetical protein
VTTPIAFRIRDGQRLPSSWIMEKVSQSILVWRLDLILSADRLAAERPPSFGWAKIVVRNKRRSPVAIDSYWDDLDDKPAMAKAVSTWFPNFPSRCDVRSAIDKEMAGSTSRGSRSFVSGARFSLTLPDRPEGLLAIVDLAKETFLRVYESCFIYSFDPTESLYRRRHQ